MQITNKQNLPEGIVRAVDTEPHNKSDKELSATQLLKGTKETILERKHWDDLTDDAANRIWAVFGTAVHSVLETEGDNDFTECQFEVPMDNGLKITGRIDNYDMKTGTITDYKTASVYKILVGDFEDWKIQGIIYAWLLANNGFKVSKARFIAILKDHSKSKAKFDSSYPQSPIVIYEFPITMADLSEAKNYIEARLDSYVKYLNKPDDEIPPCTDKERWASETVYAVMKTGNKKSVKNFTNLIEANQMAAEKGAGHYVQERPGVSRKCADYCLCRDYCNFYNSFVKNQTSEE